MGCVEIQQVNNFYCKKGKKSKCVFKDPERKITTVKGLYNLKKNNSVDNKTKIIL